MYLNVCVPSQFLDPFICFSSPFRTLLSQPRIFISLPIFVYFMGFMNKTNTDKGWNIVPVDFVSFLLCLSSNEPFLMSFSLILFPSLHLSFPFCLHFLTALASLCLFLFVQSSKNEEMGWSWGCGWFVSLVLIVINSGMLLITSRLGSLWRQQLLPVHTLSNYSNIRP